MRSIDEQETCLQCRLSHRLHVKKQQAMVAIDAARVTNRTFDDQMQYTQHGRWHVTRPLPREDSNPATFICEVFCIVSTVDIVHFSKVE